MPSRQKPKIENQTQAITELLTRGVEDVVVREHLAAALRTGKKLRIKHGIDPTGPRIHIGRAISLWKLRAFQNLGHKIVLIIGDFTAQIGDPSDKLAKRPILTAAQVKAHAKGYLAQIGNILDMKKTEVRYNSEWLAKLDFLQTAILAESFSAQQMLARRTFRERWDRGEDITMREFMYPLMQGYDSVAVKANVEIGGTDQLFNLHAGRTVQQHYKQSPQDIMMLQMLEGLDGRKMSTSWGNVVTIVDEPKDMYGKVMSLRDDLMEKYFTLCCPHLSLEEIKGLMARVLGGTESPRDTKMRLAREITTLYHGAQKAEAAEKEFVRVFQRREAPSAIKEFTLPNEFTVIDLMQGTGIITSKSEGRRLIEQGAVIFDGRKITLADNATLHDSDVPDSAILQVGPRRFVKFKKNA